MNYIERHLKELLIEAFNTSKSVAVIGARQVGKSTLISHIFPSIKKINMRDNALLRIAIDDPKLFLKNYKTPLFLDEIQKAPFILDQVKVNLDEIKENKNYIFSGSQKWELMKGLSESLAGMVTILELPNLSMREIHKINFNEPFSLKESYFKKRENNLIDYDNVWHYIYKGFYPELYNVNDKNIELFYSSYIKTYLERDVYEIIKVKDSNTFYKFMVSVAARTGSVLNCSSIANDIGIDSETVKSWIGVLEKTNIIYLLEPYYNSHLNRAIKSPKIYFRDTGLCAYLTNWKSEEQIRDGAMNGAFFETFVINEIIKSYANKGKDYKHYLYYYRSSDKPKESDSSNGEIDLIIEENNILYPIEIKKSSNVKPNMAITFTKLDKDINKKRGLGAIICNCDDLMYLRDNLVAIPIKFI